MATMATQMVTVTIPAGAKPGQQLQINVNGTLLNITVPQGAGPGTQIQVQAPVQQQVQMVQPAMAVANAVGGYSFANGIKSFGLFDSLFARQTRRDWIWECLGCQQNNEFKISSPASGVQNVLLYSYEEATFCCRFCCHNNRESRADVKMGSNQSNADAVVLHYERPLRCAAGPQKCCCYQEMLFTDENGASAGSVKEDCQCCTCVPSHTIYDKNGMAKYKLSQPTCCGGCCVDCCAEGCCNCRIPFYIYDHENYNDGEQLTGNTPEHDEKKGKGGKKNSQITKVWTNLSKELFTDSDSFEIEFPSGASAEDKAAVFGSMFYLNFLYFESQGGDN